MRCTLKLSTLNPSLQQAVKNDPRVQAFLKQEMAEHQAIIASHHKEMQELRDSLSMAMDRCTSLCENVETLINKKSAEFESLIASLNEKTKRHETLLFGHRTSIMIIQDLLSQSQKTYATHTDLEKVKGDLSSLLKTADVKRIDEFQSWQHGVNGTIKVFQSSLDALKASLSQSMQEMNNKVDKNFSVSIIDKEGVSKEVRAYQKTIFIMEKKIENLYTLIERINKRGEACHKLA